MNNFSSFLTHYSTYILKKKLKHLILHVTNHCNFRCSHCFVDFETPKKDMTFSDYQEISNNINNLFWLDIGGGEPFLRNDLYKIVNLFKKQILSIPTNGWLKVNIVDQINNMDKKNCEIVINLSLDGLEKTHNIVRKNKDSWEKVWTAFEELKKIEKIKIRFITVIHEDNYDEIIPLMKLIQSKKVDFHSVILLRGTTLDPHIKLPSIEKLNKLAVEMFDILEKYNYGQKSISAHILKNYHRYLWKTSLETIKKRTQIVPCLAGQTHMVIWGDGNISSCEMLPSFGNIKQKKLSNLLNSAEHKEQVRKIKNKECHCTHNCALVTSISFNPSKWGNLAYQKIQIKKEDKILIILDGIKNIKNEKRILQLKKNIKIIYSKKRKNSIPFNRNLALEYAKKNYYIILFLDSDVLPNNNLVKNHLNTHLKNKNIPVIGGFVIPSFFQKIKSFWEIMDGCLSWFTSQQSKNNRFVEGPYHIPTCNMSIKVSFLKSHKLKFDNNLNTGEDADFCKKVRKTDSKILLIKNAEIIHKDKVDFLSFIIHHAKWGRHQYYTLYKNNGLSKNLGFLFYFLFLILYPFLMPLINLYSTILTIYPWTKYKFIYIFLLIPSYLVHLIKGFFTYLEFLVDIKKIL